MSEESKKGVIQIKWAVISFVVALFISLGGLGVGAYFKVTGDKNVQQEQDKRLNETKIWQRQFCRLFVNIRHDKVHRYENTLVYLDTPAGEEASAINEYIRQVSLPQTRIELRKESESLPPGCFKNRKKEENR
jgi:hypothetical protein